MKMTEAYPRLGTLQPPQIDPEMQASATPTVSCKTGKGLLQGNRHLDNTASQKQLWRDKGLDKYRRKKMKRTMHFTAAAN